MMTSQERPRLREDLVAEAIEDQGHRFIDVIDPDTGSAYRFYDVEYSLACAMDGERDIAGLARWAQEELGLAPSPSELRTVIATLGDLGYLASATDVHAGAPEAQPARAASITPVGMPAVEPSDVELGRFQPAAVAAVEAPPVELELGAAGPGLEVAAPARTPDLGLGPSGHVPDPTAEALPVPDPSRTPTRPSVPRASRPKLQQPPQRPSDPARMAERAAERPSERMAERPLAAQPPASPQRASEPRVHAEAGQRRPSEQALRANALAPVASQASQASDPSLNLSLPIRPDDVKEAVRASREMRSVDVPSDLMQALEAAERAERPAEPRRRAPSSVPPPSAVPAVPPLSAAAVPTASATLAAVKPSAAVLDPISPLPGAQVSLSEPIQSPSVPPLVPVPREVRVEPSRPALVPVPREPSVPVAAAVPQPQGRSSGLLIAVLVIAILAVIGFGVWKFVLSKPATPAKEAVAPAPTAEVTPAVVEPAPAPPPPARITAKLNLVKASAVTEKMPAAGVVQSVVADGTVVKEGDSIAKLGGAKPIEQKIALLRGDLDKRYPEDVERIKANLAKAAGNRELTAQYTAELNRRNARIAQRTEEVKEAEAALAKLSIPASIAGTVTAMAKAGARLAADAEVASIEPAPYLRGTTDLKKATDLAPGSPIELSALEGGAKISCIVKIVQDSKIEFHCPLTDGFSDGTELLYEPK
ncbi:MAG: hypothetical protein IPI49_09050 [Myxococcales bacterium]|nr:hypothetical protein [Myxococcales bacterium]